MIIIIGKYYFAYSRILRKNTTPFHKLAAMEILSLPPPLESPSFESLIFEVSLSIHSLTHTDTYEFSYTLLSIAAAPAQAQLQLLLTTLTISKLYTAVHIAAHTHFPLQTTLALFHHGALSTPSSVLCAMAGPCDDSF